MEEVLEVAVIGLLHLFVLLGLEGLVLLQREPFGELLGQILLKLDEHALLLLHFSEDARAEGLRLEGVLPGRVGGGVDLFGGVPVEGDGVGALLDAALFVLQVERLGRVDASEFVLDLVYPPAEPADFDVGD